MAKALPAAADNSRMGCIAAPNTTGAQTPARGADGMVLVKVEEVAQGMVLSEDVRDINARLLLAKGQTIEGRHLRMLKMWGVFEVAVAGSDPDPETRGDAPDDALADRASQAIDRSFAALDRDHPAIREVMRLALRHRPRHFDDKHAPEEEDGAEPAEAPDSDGLLTRMARIDVQLPEVPSLVYELNDIIADPLSSSGEIARVVNKSPSLAALLLKIVNSAFYGFRSKIDSISRAVTLIGSKEVSHLALGITIMEAFKSIPRRVIDVPAVLEHNLACGIVARIIAAHGKIAAHTEQIFVSGMLHDIGRLVLCKYFPRHAMATMAHARRLQQPLLKSEQALLGTTHARLGKMLLQKWKLPYALENNVACHHNPAAAINPEMAAALQMADIVVHALGVGNSGEEILPAFDAGAWDKVRMPAGAFGAVIQQAGRQLETFREVLQQG
ncbi:HDOD domain-containing protein [Desulfatitalea alkaliphila]|uniref:HDOD domain-containing protein n=1 Tax=Desulfatitalea alkaliphila TaxID=2929485 RepID=A0AA41R011_9BACT|nr:HDOD domain-containing protein [Desulfatitalea alkaliphila]MCJ8499579.1 HDOD domain-containing protein [Desulfatitalea alkaliphila]